MRVLILGMAVLAQQQAVQVQDNGSLRTESSFIEMSNKEKIAQAKKDLVDQATQVLHSVKQMKAGLAAVSSGLSKVASMEGAESNEQRDVEKRVEAEETILKSDTQRAESHATSYNHMASGANILNSESVANVKDVNRNGQQIAAARTSFSEEGEHVFNYEKELEEGVREMENKRVLFKAITESTMTGMDQLFHWAEHATPVLNVQEDAVLELTGWVTHMEGEYIRINQMIEAMGKNLKKSVKDLMWPYEQGDLAQSEVPAAASYVYDRTRSDTYDGTETSAATETSGASLK